MAAPGADRESHAPSNVWTIVVAAGTGLRYGARKQFASLRGVSVLRWAVGAATAVSDGVVVVVPSDALETHGVTTVVTTELRVVAGGSSRAESVRCGLAAVPDDCDIVLVHDAARPMASAHLFSTVVEAIENGAQAVVPAVPITDSLRSVDGGAVDRQTVVAVQTPQGFTADVLRRAHAANGDATDDATLAERVGVDVVLVMGDPENRKITTPADLFAAEAILQQGED